MYKAVFSTVAILGLSACGGNPFAVTSSSPEGGLCTGGGVVCEGEVNQFAFNEATDTLRINNLPFDLSGNYVRDPSFDTGAFRGYRNTGGDEAYVALFLASPSGQVGAGVVGTDGYVDFGYGGSVFTSTGANLPNIGEATFSAPYAGIRVYEGNTTALGTVTGLLEMRVDFDDFDNVGAIDTVVIDRQAFDNAGNFIGFLPFLSGTTTQSQGNQIISTPVTEIDAQGVAGARGTVQGAFGGRVGAGLGGEIAGVVFIQGPDPLGTLTVRERGAFVGTQDGWTPPD